MGVKSLPLAKTRLNIFSGQGFDCSIRIHSLLPKPSKSANVLMARNHSTPFSSHTEVS